MQVLKVLEETWRKKAKGQWFSVTVASSGEVALEGTEKMTACPLYSQCHSAHVR